LTERNPIRNLKESAVAMPITKQNILKFPHFLIFAEFAEFACASNVKELLSKAIHVALNYLFILY
jgi:hypothetical protein